MVDKRKRSAQEDLGLDQYNGWMRNQHVTASVKPRVVQEPRLSFTIRNNKPELPEAQVVDEHVQWSVSEPQRLKDVAGQSRGHNIHSRYTSHDACTADGDDDYYDDDHDEDNDHDDDRLDDEDDDDDDDDDDDGSSTSEGGHGERVKGICSKIPSVMFGRDKDGGKGDRGGRSANNKENIDSGRGQGVRWNGSEGQTRLAPRCPLDHTLLRSFGSHVASTIWDGAERPVLSCCTRLEQLMKWKQPDGQQAIQHVASTGLSHLSRCMFKHVNMLLLSAFVERWHPETNSFHMPFGEMTITLHDVAYILNIPIGGKAVAHDQGRGMVIESIAACLDMDFVKVRDQFDEGGLKFVTVHQRCSRFGVPAKDVARGYLLHLLEATLFVDKTADKFSAQLFPLLDDLGKVSKYAWGAAALAHLYRQLGLASRADCKQLAGCTTLLEAWIYEYFPIFQPKKQVGWKVGDPRALRWSTDKPLENTLQRLKEYRMMLDTMNVIEVLWMPYNRDIMIDAWMSTFHGCLRFLDVIEPYMPDRVLRQFGHVQSIPIAPIRPISADRTSSNSNKYLVRYPAMESNWDDAESHLLSEKKLGSPAQPAYAVTPEYMQWFFTRTHPRVQNPIFIPKGRHFPVQRSETATEMLLRQIAWYLTPVLPERRHQLSNMQAWAYVDGASELIRGWVHENSTRRFDRPNDAGGSGHKPRFY